MQLSQNRFGTRRNSERTAISRNFRSSQASQGSSVWCLLLVGSSACRCAAGFAQNSRQNRAKFSLRNSWKNVYKIRRTCAAATRVGHEHHKISKAHLLGSKILSKAARIDFAQRLQPNFAKNFACNFRKIVSERAENRERERAAISRKFRSSQASQESSS